MQKIFISFLLACITVKGITQEPRMYSSADIYLQLKKLNVLGSVLYIAAHPDDENNGLLPYLAKEKLYRTAYLSLTRGDGGQNLIGSEQGIALGLIRSQELLAARRIDGAEQYFSTAYEFGFSKTASEALKVWDSTQVLSDIVWVIRKYQPDIIIARFPGDARAGHGHHAASSILANVAYRVAADSTAFPEQFKLGVKPWKAKRILWNTFNFGGNNTTGENQLKIDAGVFNPLLGASYGEIGGEARSMHKSQGEGRPRRKGSVVEYFVTTGGDTATKDIMEGVDVSWNRLEGGAVIESKIQTIIQQFNFNHPENTAHDLVNLYKAMQGLLDRGNWWNEKMAEIKDLIIRCSGIYTEATTKDEFVLQGDTVLVNCFINNRTQIKTELQSVKVSWDTTLKKAQLLSQNQNYAFDIKVPIHAPAIINATNPYWLQQSQRPGNFTVTNPLIIGKAWNEPLLYADFSVMIDSVMFVIHQPVEYKFIDPVRGETFEPLALQPHVSVSVTPHVALLNVTSSGQKIHRDSVTVNILSNFSANNIPASLYILTDTTHILFDKKIIDFEKGKTYSFNVAIKDILNSNTKAMEAALRINVNKSDYVYSKYFATIAYPHIPNIHYAFNDRLKLVDEPIKVVGKKVGYINGAGDKIPEALLQLGYEVKYLSEADVTEENVKQFDAIIVGIRAYNIYEWLSNKNDVLNKYVFNGGSLIVQYLKSNQVGLKNVSVGPYPFLINSGLRVTEEDATVNFLLPHHPALNYPNTITTKDFENWVQERSTYQAEKFDPHFDALLGMHDGKEKESNGSLITAKYGKGNFSYVSLVLFRQLPAGNAGAYKILANLIALPKNK